MKLQQLLQAYEFGEIFPELALMYQSARRKKEAFSKAYDLLTTMNPVPSKKQIRYQLMRDPDSDEMFFGADDNNFNSTWEVLLGKDVKKESEVELTELEIAANCLLNTILIGRCPKSFEATRKTL
ncbi:MAG: hypothetical protein IJV27_06165 [Prevotella sp.]|nr:hypothetical protein [Prevotella sp.]